MKKGHLCCEKSSGFANRLPVSILIQATTSVCTLVKSASVPRQFGQCLGLPAQCRSWLLDVCVATILDLGLINLLHKHEVSSMVPLTTFQELGLLLRITGIQILHGAPGSASRSQQNFIRTFVFKSLKEPKAVAGDVKIPASFTTECLNLGTHCSSNFCSSALASVDLPDLAASFMQN